MGTFSPPSRQVVLFARASLGSSIAVTITGIVLLAVAFGSQNNAANQDALIISGAVLLGFGGLVLIASIIVFLVLPPIKII
jgi:uncharacterized membrane protein